MQRQNGESAVFALLALDLQTALVQLKISRERLSPILVPFFLVLKKDVFASFPF
jgi:hypothetical protein